MLFNSFLFCECNLNTLRIHGQAEKCTQTSEITFMHVEDIFIERDLHCFQDIDFTVSVLIKKRISKLDMCKSAIPTAFSLQTKRSPIYFLWVCSFRLNITCTQRLNLSQPLASKSEMWLIKGFRHWSPYSHVQWCQWWHEAHRRWIWCTCPE